MPQARSATARRLVGVAAMGVAVATCSEPTKPEQPTAVTRRTVAMADTVTGTYADSAPGNFYVLRTTASARAVAFATAAVPLWIEVRDSAGPLVGSVVVPAGNTGLPLLALRGPAWSLAAGHTYHLDVRSTVTGAVGPYRFVLVPLDSAPEHRAAPIAADDTVDEESLEHSADVDAFSVAAQAGDEFILFFEVLDATADNTVGIEVRDGAGALLTAMRNARNGQGLEVRSTGRFPTSSSGTLRIAVRDLTADGAVARAGTTRYRFQLRRALRPPEHIAQSIAVGDTVTGERIDYPGDVDEFTFAAPPDSLVNIFVEAPGSAGRTFHVQLPAVHGVDMLAQTGRPGILSQASGRVRLPHPGTFTIRVNGLRDTLLGDTGSYRLFLFPVDPRPETAAATIVPGDSVEAERLTIAGDLDVYSFTVADSLLGNVSLRPKATGAAGLKVTMRREAPDTAWIATVALATADSTVGAGAGRIHVPPGTYSLVVEGTSSLADGYQGGYHLGLYAFDLGPEVAPDSLVVGDSIIGEALDAPGDVDSFRLYARAGQFAYVDFAGKGTATRGGFQVEVSPPDDPWYLTSLVALPGDSVAAPRFDVRRTGWYTLKVWCDGYDGVVPGPYRLVLAEYPVHPEAVSAALAVGDSVVGERIDTLGDVDEFDVAAAPGSPMQTWAELPDGIQARILLPDTEVVLAGPALDWATAALGRVVVPPSGHLRIRVYTPSPDPGAGGFAVTGAYRLRTLELSPAPESIPATVAVGDTIAGEALDPEGDVDTFTFAVTAGDTLTVSVDLQYPVFDLGDDDAVGLTVFEPGTGTVVAQALGAGSTGYLWDLKTAPFVATATGTLSLRIQGPTGRHSRGPYRLLVDKR